MKNPHVIVLLILTFASLPSFNQTIDIEKDNLMEKYLGGEFTQQGNASRLIINGSIEIPFPDMFMVWKNDWKGYVETELQNSGICYFTLVFTIREGRMKSQVINISYEYTDYVSNQTVNRPLKSCFPVTNHPQKEWKSIMTQVKETEAGLGTMMEQLITYINEYKDDYDW